MGLFANLKALWENRKTLAPIGNAVMEIKQSAVKDGFKTSEFWGKTLVQVFTVLAIFKPELKLDPALALQIVAVTESLYHAFRMLVKASAPQEIIVTPLSVPEKETPPTPTPLP